VGGAPHPGGFAADPPLKGRDEKRTEWKCTVH
jgi:hypothetical protein